ncbi:MAG: DUF6785 family protein [Armatimonadota bacterium]
MGTRSGSGLEVLSHSKGSAKPAQRRSGVSFRAVLIGLLGIPLNTYWMVLTYWRFGNDAGTPYPIYYNCVFYLFALAGLNTILRRRRPQLAFSLGELLTIYIMLSVATAWCGVDLLIPLPEAISGSFWFASPGNHWADVLWPNLPNWLMVSDPQVLQGFYEGETNPYTSTILLAWAGPALWWTAIATALMLCYVCVSSIFRRRWVDDEKLLFPIITVPLQIAEERHHLSRNKLMWIGFSLVAIVELFATFHGFFPAVPVIPFYFDLGPWIDQHPPWNAYRWKGIGLWPILISLSYLMPLDLAFSLWFFNLFWKAELIISTQFAWTTNTYSGFPYVDMQSLGGLMAILGSVLWLDRRYLAEILRKVLGLPSSLDDTAEPMSYRGAALGGIGALGFICYAFGRAGMPIWATLAWFASLLIISLVLTRVRAQLGPPHFEQVSMGPNQFLPALFGSAAIPTRGIAMLWLSYPFTSHHAQNPDPWTLETYKLADSHRMELRRLPWVLVGTTALVVPCIFWASLHVLYNIGARAGADPFASGHARQVPLQMASMLENPSSGPSPALLSAVGVGLIGTLLLMALKLRFYAWPLHPIAFPIASAWVMDSALPAVFIAWLVKAIIMRYGGLRLYRAALPFFLGMILSQSVIGFVRMTIGAILNIDMPFL